MDDLYNWNIVEMMILKSKKKVINLKWIKTSIKSNLEMNLF